MPKVKEQKLTMKEKGFVQDLIKTKNPAEAVRRNYDLGSQGGKQHNNTAYNIASTNLSKPKIQKELKRVLKKHDLTEDYLIDKLKESIDKGVNESARNKSIETGLKLHGHLGHQPGISSGGSINIQYNELKETDLHDKLNKLTQKLTQFTQGGREEGVIEGEYVDKEAKASEE